MFDLSKETVTINCPTCNRAHVVSFQHVMNKSVVHCPCSTNITLQDGDGSVKSGIKNMNNAFKGLEDTLKKLGK